MRTRETGSIAALAARYAQRVTRDEIVLYAGTNLPAPSVAAMLASPLGMMPAMGRGGRRDQPGVDEIVAIEAAAEALTCGLFGAAWAEVRLASGTLANLAVFGAFCRPGDTICATALAAGGHVSHHANGAPRLMDLRVVELPHDAAGQRPDDEAAAAVIRALRPKLVILGASFVPRAYGFARIAAACRDTRSVLVYDIAHVAGLVAGGAFPNPLEGGADLVTASTYKSLGGPPGGFIAGRDPGTEALVRAVAHPALTANYDASRVAALAVCLQEAEHLMQPYARTMLDNARALERALAEQGLAAIEGETHHIGLPVGDKPAAEAAMSALERNGILCGICAMLAPGASHGLRIGTQLLTRRGFAPGDMAELASLIARGLKQDDIGAEATRWSRRRHELAFVEDWRAI